MKQTTESRFCSMHILASLTLLSAGVFLTLLGTAASQALTRQSAPESVGVRNAGVMRYNGLGKDYDEAAAIAVDNAGNVYVTGASVGAGGDLDYATIKYSAGRQQWVARYNGPGNSADKAQAIAVDNAGNVYVTGWSYVLPNSNNADYATIKYNSAGEQQWVAYYNGPGNLFDEATAIAVDESGNVFVTGDSWGSGGNLDYATIKYDSSGQQQWVARYNGPADFADVPTAIALDNSGNVYVTGYSSGSGNDFDYATISITPSGKNNGLPATTGLGTTMILPVQLLLIVRVTYM